MFPWKSAHESFSDYTKLITPQSPFLLMEVFEVILSCVLFTVCLFGTSILLVTASESPIVCEQFYLKWQCIKNCSNISAACPLKPQQTSPYSGFIDCEFHKGEIGVDDRLLSDASALAFAIMSMASDCFVTCALLMNPDLRALFQVRLVIIISACEAMSMLGKLVYLVVDLSGQMGSTEHYSWISAWFSFVIMSNSFSVTLWHTVIVTHIFALARNPFYTLELAKNSWVVACCSFFVMAISLSASLSMYVSNSLGFYTDGMYLTGEWKAAVDTSISVAFFWACIVVAYTAYKLRIGLFSTNVARIRGLVCLVGFITVYYTIPTCQTVFTILQCMPGAFWRACSSISGLSMGSCFWHRQFLCVVRLYRHEKVATSCRGG